MEIPLRRKYRYQAPGTHKSTHDMQGFRHKRADWAGMQGAARTKHSWWTTSTQWGSVLNGGRVPKPTPPPTFILDPDRNYRLVKLATSSL